MEDSKQPELIEERDAYMANDGWKFSEKVMMYHDCVGRVMACIEAKYPKDVIKSKYLIKEALNHIVSAACDQTMLKKNEIGQKYTYIRSITEYQQFLREYIEETFLQEKDLETLVLRYTDFPQKTLVRIEKVQEKE